MEAQWQTSLSDPISIDRPDEVADSEIEIVVRQHARFVYKIAYFVLRNHYDAEDVTQETFLRVMKHRKQSPKYRICAHGLLALPGERPSAAKKSYPRFHWTMQ